MPPSPLLTSTLRLPTQLTRLGKRAYCGRHFAVIKQLGVRRGLPEATTSRSNRGHCSRSAGDDVARPG